MINEALQALFDLRDRVAVITGGVGMLGRRYAETLLMANARVVIVDLPATAPDQVASALADRVGGKCVGIAGDVSQKQDMCAMVDEVVRTWGRIDILVNNAAIDPKFDVGTAAANSQGFEQYPLDQWQASLDVNLTGAFLCSQRVGKVMVEQGGGVIINISSTYGLVAPDQRLYSSQDDNAPQLFKPAGYAVTKAGIAHLTRYLAAYWGHNDIRVNTLTPGGVYNKQDTEFVKKYSDRTMMGRMARAEELCGALLFLVSDASSYMTGANLVVDGGWTAW